MIRRIIFIFFISFCSVLKAQQNTQFETGQFKKVKSSELSDVSRIITEEEIRLRGANNLKDILIMETGGIFNYNAQKGWQFNWHGSTKGNILILMDGLPFRSVQFDEMDLQQIPLDNISRIEIIENPQGIAYGTSAIMGVINIISKATQLKVIKPSLRFQGYNPGSFYSNINLGARTTENFFRFSSSVDAFAGRQGNDSGRVLQWLPYTRVNNHLFFSHKILQNMDVSAGFNNLYENKTELGYPYPQTVRAYDRELKTNTNSITAGIKGRLTKIYHLQGDLLLMDYSRKNTLFLKDISTAQQKEVNDTALNDTIHYFYGFSRWVISQIDKNKPINYQVGFDISSTKDKYKPLVNNVNQVNTTTSLFVNIKYSGVKNLLLYGGFRLPYSSKYKTKPLYDFKLNYKLTDEWLMKFMIARSTKAPTFDQMFATYLTNGYSIKRNLNLTDESALSFHYSMIFKKDKLSIEPGFFNYFFRDGIELVMDKINKDRFVHKNLSEKKTIGTRINIAYQDKFFDINVRGILTSNNYFANLFDRQLSFTELYSNLIIKIPKLNLQVCYVQKMTSKRGYMALDAVDGLKNYFNDPFYLADAVIEKSFNKKTIYIRAGIKNIANIKNVNSFYLPVEIQPHQMPNYYSTAILGGRNFFIELNINI